jgi:hypothetical protein
VSAGSEKVYRFVVAMVGRRPEDEYVDRLSDHPRRAQEAIRGYFQPRNVEAVSEGQGRLPAGRPMTWPRATTSGPISLIAPAPRDELHDRLPCDGKLRCRPGEPPGRVAEVGGAGAGGTRRRPGRLSRSAISEHAQVSKSDR